MLYRGGLKIMSMGKVLRLSNENQSTGALPQTHNEASPPDRAWRCILSPTRLAIDPVTPIAPISLAIIVPFRFKSTASPLQDPIMHY